MLVERGGMVSGEEGRRGGEGVRDVNGGAFERFYVRDFFFSPGNYSNWQSHN